MEPAGARRQPLVDAGVLRYGVVMGRKWFCDRSGNLDLTRVATSALCGGRELSEFDPTALAAHVESASEMSFEAPRSLASTDATVSALMLRGLPDSSPPRLASTRRMLMRHCSTCASMSP